MSRKNRPKPGSVSPSATPQAAEAALAASRYKEAIEHFKALLKRERSPVWLEGLAAAYAGRADQLAAMFFKKRPPAGVALMTAAADANKGMARVNGAVKRLDLLVTTPHGRPLRRSACTNSDTPSKAQVRSVMQFS